MISACGEVTLALANLVPNQSELEAVDRRNRTITSLAISITGDPTGTIAFDAAISANGRWAAYGRTAQNDPFGQSITTVVRDLSTGQTRTVSVAGRILAISDDGATLLLGTAAQGPGGATRIVTVATGTVATASGQIVQESRDLQVVAYVPNPGSAGPIVILNRSTGVTRTFGIVAPLPDVTMSSNGRYAAYRHDPSSIVPNPGVYVIDIVAGAESVVPGSQSTADGISSVSDDGQVAVMHGSTLFPDHYEASVTLLNLATGTITPVVSGLSTPLQLSANGKIAVATPDFLTTRPITVRDI